MARVPDKKVECVWQVLRTNELHEPGALWSKL